MSGDPSPSSAAPPAEAPTTALSDEADPATAPDQDAASQARSLSPSRRRRRRKSRRRRNPGLAKKLEFITHLLRSLDILFFAELSALYYMECSMFQFIIRSAGQYMYLSPKDESFPFLMPASRLHVALVVFPNVICMLIHAFASLPVGAEFHRGYLHGGLIIDFVGQKPPTYRLYYILADVTILVIQCLMLTIHTERESLRAALKTFRPLLPETGQESSQGRTLGDLDAEERGVSQETSGVGEDETNDIELRSMEGSGDRGDNDDASTEVGGLSRVSSTTDDSQRSHLSDILNSGNAVIGEYHVIHSIRTAAMELEGAAANSLRSMSYGATMAALEARRRGAAAQTRTARARR